jgi:MFS family permease
MPDRDAAAPLAEPSVPWYRELTGYHWWILIVATMGWMFDTMDQRIFVLARQPAIQELLTLSAVGGESQTAAQLAADVKWYSSLATAFLLIGWATGGLIFGFVGDRLGRKKTLATTVALYSVFTGLSALSVSWWDFCLYRFLTGLGVGGAFSAAVTLVAEVMPSRARPHALGILQAVSAIGNIGGSLLSWFLLRRSFDLGWAMLPDGQFHGWRLTFLVGVLPALLILVVMKYVKEPDSWLAARDAALRDAAAGRTGGVKLGSWREMFGDARWRRNVIVGVLLVTAGAVGLWGIGFWTPELIRDVLADQPQAEQSRVSSLALALQDVGAFFGMMVFTAVTAKIGRRKTFALSFLLCFVVVFGVFAFLGKLQFLSPNWQIYLATPMVGFATLTVFGGYAIYLPELFPTRLRSTGTGFCYNVARYITAAGALLLGGMTLAFEQAGFSEPFRASACTMSIVFILGLLVLPFAPETKDQPLPE